MNRRKTIVALGLFATPIALASALAEEQARTRCIGVLMGLNSADPVAQPEVAALELGLAELGWRSGSDLRIEYRWAAGGDSSRARTQARELVEAHCELIISRATPMTAAAVREAKGIPVVFVQVSDPVGDRFVATLARPGGNVTGFTNIEASLGAKWLELLKQMSPAVSRVAMLYSPKTSPDGGRFFARPFEAAAAQLGVQPASLPIDSDTELEKAFVEIAKWRGGFIVAPGLFLLSRRELILGLATRHRLPAIYPFTFWANLGGLMSYGSDTPDLFRRASLYVDRILKGAKPADLPVQAPVKFELVVNRNAAKTINLTVPQSLLLRADRVIE